MLTLKHFLSPSGGETYLPGDTINISTLNFGLSSRFHVSTISIFLHNTGKNVTSKAIANSKLSRFLHDVLRTNLDKPANSTGFMLATIPADTEPGKYRIRFVSGWYYQKVSRFVAESPEFTITAPAASEVESATSNASNATVKAVPAASNIGAAVPIASA